MRSLISVPVSLQWWWRIPWRSTRCIRSEGRAKSSETTVWPRETGSYFPGTLTAWRRVLKEEKRGIKLRYLEHLLQFNIWLWGKRLNEPTTTVTTSTHLPECCCCIATEVLLKQLNFTCLQGCSLIQQRPRLQEAQCVFTSVLFFLAAHRLYVLAVVSRVR